jgi:hypothetical protein
LKEEKETEHAKEQAQVRHTNNDPNLELVMEAGEEAMLSVEQERGGMKLPVASNDEKYGDLKTSEKTRKKIKVAAGGGGGSHYPPNGGIGGYNDPPGGGGRAESSKGSIKLWDVQRGGGSGIELGSNAVYVFCYTIVLPFSGRCLIHLLLSVWIL